MDPRTRLLLEAPVGPTILRLALPNVVVMVVQASIGLIETYFVAKLGLDALAGMALVFPLFMLLQMVSAGAMGGGILSAIARALGSGNRDRANELVWSAVAITIGLGALTTVAALLFGPKLYALMGGRADRSPRPRPIPLWCSRAPFRSGCSIRSPRSFAAPATCFSRRPSSPPARFVLIPLSPLLIFGLGPFPQLGIAGGAAAVVLYYSIGCAIFAGYIWSGRGVLKPSLVPPKLAGRRCATFFASARRRPWSACRPTSASRPRPALPAWSAPPRSPVTAPARGWSISWCRWCSAWRRWPPWSAPASAPAAAIAPCGLRGPARRWPAASRKRSGSRRRSFRRRGCRCSATIRR